MRRNAANLMLCSSVRWQHAKGRRILHLDPLPLMGSMIGITQRIGLAASWTVDFTEPYHVARVFATLDHLSYGRSAWFVDMFDTERLLPLIGKPKEASDTTAYCARAAEFIDSGEGACGTVGRTKGSRSTRRPACSPILIACIRSTTPDAFFAVRGPLNVPRPPQGMPPLIMRDPADDTARAFVASARWTSSSTDDAIAAKHARALRASADDAIFACLTNLTLHSGRNRGGGQAASRRVDRRRHPICFIGTPAQLVDVACQACTSDGFNLLTGRSRPADRCGDPAGPTRRPGSHEYGGTTLREHFGLHRPRSQFTPEGAA